MICEHFRKWVEVVDHRAAQVAMGLLLVLAVELLLSFVIEFYRPRMPGEGERPLPESRVLALFTEPGGVARNVATSLDYQFGFRVSEVWFYRFLERTALPFAVCMVLLLWLLTCVVTVDPHENGIRELLGRVARDAAGAPRILPPGLYVKLPWPLARIQVFPVAQVQEVIIGHDDEAAAHQAAEEEKEPEDDGHGHTPPKKEKDTDESIHGAVILWSGGRHKVEINYAVGNALQPGTGGGPGESAPTTVSLMAADIPVYFRVSNLYDYAYGHQDNAKAELKALATREVVRYLAEADFGRVLGAGRSEAALVLQQRIQAAADRVQLGITVVFVGLQALHPPVDTGAAFDGVVAASEQMHQTVLEAEAYAARRKPEAEGAHDKAVKEAEAYRSERGQVAQAEAERFGKQLMAYRASPKLFVLNSYLDVLENEGAAIRKYVVATTRGTEVFVIDLKEKLRPDLLDLDVGTAGEQK